MAVAVPGWSSIDVLREAFDDVASVDIDTLDEFEVHADVFALRSYIDRLQALEARFLARWDANRTWADTGSLSAASRLKSDGGLSERTAKHLVRRANRLLTMPFTSAAFFSGSLSADKVDLLVRANQPEVSEVFARDEKTLVEQLDALSHFQAERVITYWSRHANPDGADDQDRSNHALRRAHTAKILDGVGKLDATLDPVGTEIFFGELQRIESEFFEAEWSEAKKLHGDNTGTYHLPRSAAQRRCDALVEMAQRSASRPKDARTPKPLFVVTLGEDRFRHVSELATGTIVGAESLLPYLTDSMFQSVLFGGLKDIKKISKQRTFVGTLRRALEVRDRHCQHASGCDVPAYKCQGDHITAWSKGGITSLDGGELLCAKHNRAKGTGPP